MLQGKVYIAGGWFSEEQEKALSEIENYADTMCLHVFKPRSDNLGSDGCDWDSIFAVNIAEIETSDIIIASTVGKDMGTLWECGYAYALNKPILYYTPGISKPNLMLAMSGKVFNTIVDMDKYIRTGVYNEPKDIE